MAAPAPGHASTSAAGLAAHGAGPVAATSSSSSSSSSPFSSAPLHPPTAVPAQPPFVSLAPRWTPEQVRSMVHRFRELQAAGDPANPELLALRSSLMTLRQVAQARETEASQSAASLSAPDASPSPTIPAESRGASAPTASTGGFPNLLAPEQLRIVQAQLQAYKLLVRGVPLPSQIQSAITAPTPTLNRLTKQLPDLAPLGARGKVAEVAAESHLAARLSRTIQEHDLDLLPNGPDGKPKQVDAAALARIGAPPATTSYPSDTHTHPFSHLANPTLPASQDAYHDTVAQKLLTPSLFPAGVAPGQLLAERDGLVQARIEQRIAELESLPSIIASGSPTYTSYAPTQPHDLSFNDAAQAVPTTTTTELSSAQAQAQTKLRSLIERKTLQLLPKQRDLRAEVAQSMDQAAVMINDKATFRKFRKQTLREARMTESLGRKQRAEEEKREQQKHTDYLSTIFNHGSYLLQSHRSAQSAQTRLTRSLLKLHGDTEREEAKRVERVAKERLQALRADDEEAYLKLIDTAKDTRIAHLLGQTDKYLGNLAHAVQAQQSDEVHTQIGATNGVDESIFGASKMEDEDDDIGQGKTDYYGTAHRIRETITKQPSILVGGDLKDYQIKGLQWMVSLYNNHLNGILADEMGLGKTIQTISLITYLIEKKRQPAPYLVIVPLSTLQNWVSEFHKWAPSVNLLVYKGQPPQRRELANRVKKGDWQVLLTTYEFIIKDKNVLSKKKWIHMIMDEGHRMKNASSKLAVTLTQFYTSRYRLLLTGTPLQNNLPELWALLNFVLPKIFDSVKSFDEWFNTPFANAGGSDTSMQLNEEEQLLIIKRLHKVLRPFLLRRLKKDVESELPEKVEKVIKCAKSALQAKLYSQMTKHKTLFTGTELGGTKPGASTGGGLKGLQNMLMQLRKVCQHPYVFDEVELAVNPTKATGPDLYRVSGKFELLDRILPKLRATGHRVLMFFQMTQIMDIMEDFLRYRGLTYLRLDGSTKQDERGAMLAEFNKPDSPYFMFILSTRAGGLGLNLQSADTVIIFDSDFNPHQDLQAQDRAHRIGQKMEVRIFRLVTEKSVEEKILEIAHRKLDMDSKVIQAGRFHESATNEERDSLLRAMLESTDDDEADNESEMTDEAVNALLARSTDEETRFVEMDTERERLDQEEWVARGGTGPHPPRLITEDELPPHFQQAFEDEYTASLAATQNGVLVDDLAPRRRAAAVRYDDNLTDSQFLAALENDQDPAVVAAAKRAKAEKRSARPSVGGLRASGSPDVHARSPLATSPPITAGSPSRDLTPSLQSSAPSPGPRSHKRKRPSTPLRDSSSTPAPAVPDTTLAPSQPKKRKSNANRTPERDMISRGLNQCYAALTACKDETGRSRAALFIDLPSGKLYPDYRLLISNPICMRQIKRRIDGRVYKDLATAKNDVHLMVRNAQTYNQEGSWVWEDARVLREAWDQEWNKLVSSPPYDSLPGADGIAPPDAVIANNKHRKAEAAKATTAAPAAPPAPPATTSNGNGHATQPPTNSSNHGSGLKLRLNLGGSRKVTLSRKS